MAQRGMVKLWQEEDFGEIYITVSTSEDKEI